ncbi:sigma 54-interacting transcriptional regulator, partial [Vibrio sp. 2026]|uniref:sigma 54-interacting transcriptional regulator n=1 Tax=Vibrio sp. 2026 TaxID=3074588 RepID=UPI0029650357
MPMERHNTELLSLVDNLPDPVFAIDLKGAVDMANMSALSLLGLHKQEVIGTQIGALLPSVRFSRWYEGVNARTRENLVIDGLDYILELMPVYIRDEAQNSTLASTLMTIRTSQHGTQIEERLPLHNPLGFEHFVGISNRHKALINQAKKLSVLDQPLLIEGETGTGKEMLAKACHSRSSRASKPFLVLSCASMPDDVAETELFGHAPGSFNHEQGHKGIFEQANGGTVFLDEIGDMPMSMQVKLLRVLQERCFERVGGNSTIKVNVRVVAATHRNLESMIEEGTFREDLFYRLNVFPIEMPALKERKQDIPLLLQELMTRLEAEGGQPICFTPRAINSLMEHHWPGNVRELANLVERMIILYPNSLVDVNHLPTKYRYSDIPEFQPEGNPFTSIEEQERDVFQDIFSEDFSFDEQSDLDHNM